jgi:hypothetical protein
MVVFDAWVERNWVRCRFVKVARNHHFFLSLARNRIDGGVF